MRACADAGVVSVAVYADSDREALHVSLADEAYALNGARAADTYLDADKIIEVARRCAADALHPGYGFLAENAGFARAVLAAGLIWIGPPPEAIDALGDKVSARHIAQRVGAPLVPGTPEPVDDVAQVRAFVAEHGLPIAIKAAFGGGGRGLKVVNAHDQVEAMFESAVREATAAFGRGECFVERYLDSPRHVETQCLADAHGGVVVVSTRDCSLQRRHQKLVEEAPAPFLTAEQERVMRNSSIAILRAAGYVGAGTCEFLVGSDGTVSFLEVNTRLQVEHPVSEEVTGIDLVREQLRIAAGEPLGYTEVAGRGDPQLLADQVDAGDLLGDRVLHLQTGVDLEEGHGPVRTHQELARPRADVAGGPQDGDRGIPHHPLLLRGKAGGRRLLDELLVPALQGAVAGGHDDDATVGVREALGLHVAR